MAKKKNKRTGEGVALPGKTVQDILVIENTYM